MSKNISDDLDEGCIKAYDGPMVLFQVAENTGRDAWRDPFDGIPLLWNVRETTTRGELRLWAIAFLVHFPDHFDNLLSPIPIPGDRTKEEKLEALAWLIWDAYQREGPELLKKLDKELPSDGSENSANSSGNSFSIP